MRVILGSSSIVTPPPPPPPPPQHPKTHQHNHRPKPKSKHSINKLFPSSSRAASSAIPTVHSSRSPRLYTAPQHLTSRQKYHADLASKLAGKGRLEEFAMVVESVVVSGVNASKFVQMLSVELVSSGISRSIREGRIWWVVEVLKQVDKLGVPPLKLLDRSALELLKRECQRIMDCGQVEEFVDLMEIFGGN